MTAIELLGVSLTLSMVLKMLRHSNIYLSGGAMLSLFGPVN